MKRKTLGKYVFPLSLAIFIMALMPLEAQASLVCAPDGRGCYHTRVKCKDIDLVPRWTCTGKIAFNPQIGDRLDREADGRVAAVVNGKKIFMLSDALEAQLIRNRPSADEFVRLVSIDRGSVSEESILRLSKELDEPLVKQSVPKR